MEILTREVMRLAFCWRIERRDGAGLALTSHDAPIDVGGIRFSPGSGLTPKSLRFDNGKDRSHPEIEGGISDDALSREDLLGGQWDGASLRLFMVDWAAPDDGEVVLVEGELGQVDRVGERFEVSLLTAFAQMARPACPETSPLCRARLGDTKCRVDMAGRTDRYRVVAVEDHAVTLDRNVGDAAQFGEVRWLDGPARGRRDAILSVEGAKIVLRDRSPVEVMGTRVAVREGCDKMFETCVSRFDNAENFRGEPHLPGTDLLTRYPGA